MVQCVEAHLLLFSLFYEFVLNEGKHACLPVDSNISGDNRWNCNTMFKIKVFLKYPQVVCGRAWKLNNDMKSVCFGHVVLQMSRRVQCSFIDKFFLWHVSGPWSRCSVHTHAHTKQDTKLAEHSPPPPSPPVSAPVCPSAEKSRQLFWLGASMSQVPSHILLAWACLLSILPVRHIYYTESEVMHGTTAIKTLLTYNKC